jgi:hypothetical protein
MDVDRGFYPLPDIAERARIRQSLNMRDNQKFWRCKGKSRVRVEAFEKAGDMSHSAQGHVCEECRCRKVAGMHTDHYGIGYCWWHDNAKGMTDRRIQEMKDCTMTAIRQGYPDRVYKYESNNAFLERVRQASEEAGGMTDLREELITLRGMVQELIGNFEKNRRELIEGYDAEGMSKPMTDATYFKLVTGGLESIARISEKNLKITEQDYVHVDQVTTWFASILRLLQRYVQPESEETYNKVVEEIKLLPSVKRGRIK